MSDVPSTGDNFCMSEFSEYTFETASFHRTLIWTFCHISSVVRIPPAANPSTIRICKLKLSANSCFTMACRFAGNVLIISVDLKIENICWERSEPDSSFLTQLFPTAVTRETTKAPPRNRNWTVVAVPTAILTAVSSFYLTLIEKRTLTQILFLKNEWNQQGCAP